MVLIAAALEKEIPAAKEEARQGGVLRLPAQRQQRDGGHSQRPHRPFRGALGEQTAAHPAQKAGDQKTGAGQVHPPQGEAALPGKGGRQAWEKATAAQPRTRATMAMTLPFAGACQQLPARRPRTRARSALPAAARCERTSGGEEGGPAR